MRGPVLVRAWWLLQSPCSEKDGYLDDRVAIGEPKSSRSIAETASSEEVDLERVEWKVPQSCLQTMDTDNCIHRASGGWNTSKCR
jgi:hypothetical protein